MERVDNSNVLNGALKPFQNYKTERLTHFVVRQTQETKVRAVLRMPRHVRRKESRQIQRSPDIFGLGGIGLHGMHMHWRLNKPMRLKQIEQCGQAHEIPVTDACAQTVGVTIQICPNGRDATAMRVIHQTLRDRAIKTTKQIALEPLTRVIQTVVAPDAIQQHLDFVVRKTEPSITPTRQRRRRPIGNPTLGQRKLGRTGALAHKTRQSQRVAGVSNGVEEHSAERL